MVVLGGGEVSSERGTPVHPTLVINALSLEGVWGFGTRVSRPANPKPETQDYFHRLVSQVTRFRRAPVQTKGRENVIRSHFEAWWLGAYEDLEALDKEALVWEQHQLVE